MGYRDTYVVVTSRAECDAMVALYLACRGQCGAVRATGKLWRFTFEHLNTMDPVSFTELHDQTYNNNVQDAPEIIERLFRTVETQEGFLIWSNYNRAWWRPNRSGYTTHAEAAGVYSRAEAREICRHARDGWVRGDVPSEVPVPADLIKEIEGR